MENIFQKYMDERFGKSSIIESSSSMGPVITISRVSGCSATVIAETLTRKINEFSPSGKNEKCWNWINKQILSLASDELNVNPQKIKEFVEADKKNILDEIVTSFTDKYYVHSSQVSKVIADVIRTIAVKGNVVIVGRAGSLIAADILKSLHVNLEAPLSWRSSVITSKKNITVDEAKKYILQMDKQRISFKKSYMSSKSETPDYDISLNCKTHTVDQICEIIMKEAQLRNLF